MIFCVISWCLFYLAGRAYRTAARCLTANRHNMSVAARIIYSTGIGSLCPNCRRALRECVCPKGAPGVQTASAVRVGRETKGRAGKGVTTVTGLPLAMAPTHRRGAARIGALDLSGHKDRGAQHRWVLAVSLLTFAARLRWA